MELLIEIWKDIPDHVGYQASSFGQIRSRWTNSGKMGNDWHIIAQITNERGYKRCLIRKQKKPRMWFVHRLVMLTFVGNPDGKQVNHINFNRADNSLKNLEYVTSSENQIHSYRHGRKCKKGENHHGNKISELQAHEIKYKETGLHNVIALKYGISKAQISNIKRGKSWSHI